MCINLIYQCACGTRRKHMVFRVPVYLPPVTLVERIPPLADRNHRSSCPVSEQGGSSHLFLHCTPYADKPSSNPPPRACQAGGGGSPNDMPFPIHPIHSHVHPHDEPRHCPQHSVLKSLDPHLLYKPVLKCELQLNLRLISISVFACCHYFSHLWCYRMRQHPSGRCQAEINI